MSCANPTSKGPCGGRLHQEKRFDPIARLSSVHPPTKPLRSFFIADILNARGSEPRAPYTTAAAAPTPGTGPRLTGAIKRPWDDNHSNRSGGYSTDVEDDEEVDDDDEEEISVDDEKGQSQLTTKSVVCPLDALLKMTSKTFDSQDKSTSENESSKRDHNGLGGINSKSQSSKKRRKSRTAFTNKQIYELEKRFLYQKYLTPVDRDEIALSLGLTNAQVITWFQNRRAKLKRDMEELKADVTAAKALGPETAITVIGSLDDLQQGSKATPTPKSRHSRRKDGRNAASTTTTTVMSCGESNDSSSTPGSAARSSTPGGSAEESSRGSVAAAAASATGVVGNHRGSTEEDVITIAGSSALTPVDEKDSRAVDKFKDGD